MLNINSSFTELPLEVFDSPHAGDVWERCALAALPDNQLVEAAMATITPPKIEPPSSFVLHAPLELLARAALLRYVRPDARASARRQIAAVAVRYAHAGSSIAPVNITHAQTETALPALVEALRCGDADGADGALLFLMPRLSMFNLRAALIDEIAPCLGAAGHAPILLAALAHSKYVNATGLLRAPLRMLAASPQLRLTWFSSQNENIKLPQPTHDRTLFDRLAAPPRLMPTSTSIAAMAIAVQQSGDACRLLGPAIHDLSLPRAEESLLRVAAYSMLQDDPAKAPYGWTHCLSLAQGLLRNADASTNHRALIAVAATHVLANRAILGRVVIHTKAPPKSSSLDLDDADPLTAASIAFHALFDRRKEMMSTLATFASTHQDAHLVKYTLACFESAANDAEAATLFMAAAAYLGAWWRHSARA